VVTDSEPAGASLASAALAWYDSNGRDLVFRRTSDPWAVLVSEVMAQQTQAARAAGHWARFMAAYPTPADFAAASTAEAIRAWRGLGYNRRAVALRAAAIEIRDRHGGRVPDALDALVALPGIGPYTARAVLAIGYGRPVAALDTNIRRVLDRALGGLPASNAERQKAADALVLVDRPADWTHALMDIGATLCRAREVRCEACPLARHCALAQSGEPVRVAVDRTPAGGRPTPFPATTRWLRGRILDRLRDASDGGWIVFDSPIGEHPIDRVRVALADLARQRMVELDAASPDRARLPA
jgi:A/G-specific adenine glycosylase